MAVGNLEKLFTYVAIELFPGQWTKYFEFQGKLNVVDQHKVSAKYC